MKPKYYISYVECDYPEWNNYRYVSESYEIYTNIRPWHFIKSRKKQLKKWGYKKSEIKYFWFVERRNFNKFDLGTDRKGNKAEVQFYPSTKF